MKRTRVCVVFLIFFVAGSLVNVNMGYANLYLSFELPTITLRGDGSIYSSIYGDTVPIQRNGSIYSLTGNISDYQLIVACDNITLDGAGCIISVHASYINGVIESWFASALTIHSSNVVAKNLNITSDATGYGILAEGSNCTITSSTISGGAPCLWLSGSKYHVTNNNFLGSDIGVYLKGNDNVISGNSFYNRLCVEICEGTNNIISDNFFWYVQSDTGPSNIFKNNFSTKINSIPYNIAYAPTPPPTSPKPSGDLLLSVQFDAIIILIAILAVALISILFFRRHHKTSITSLVKKV
jgi:hypothetical protein